VILPADVVVLAPQTGTANMGDVTDEASPCRFWLPGVPRFALVSLRALFVGGTGTAELLIRKDHSRGSNFDFKDWRISDAGTDGTARVSFRIPEDEIYHYIYDMNPQNAIQDQLVVTWTNPDSGTMRWSLEVGLIDAANIVRG